MPEPIPQNRNVGRTQDKFQIARQSEPRYRKHSRAHMRSRLILPFLRAFAKIWHQLRTRLLPPILQVYGIMHHQHKIWGWFAGRKSFLSTFGKVLILFVGIGVLGWFAPIFLAVLSFVKQIISFIFIILSDIVHVAWLIASPIFSHSGAIFELISAHPFVIIIIILLLTLIGIVIGLTSGMKRN